MMKQTEKWLLYAGVAAVAYFALLSKPKAASQQTLVYPNADGSYSFLAGHMYSIAPLTPQQARDLLSLLGPTASVSSMPSGVGGELIVQIGTDTQLSTPTPVLVAQLS